MNETRPNVDTAELAKFARIAHRWWDPHGEFKPLHALNPVRLAFVETHAPLAGRKVLDVGCGGGLLSEAMAQRGAVVTGIDAGAETLASARLHAFESGASVEYELATAEDFALAHPSAYDVVTCMELIEHVPDPESLIAACAKLVRPGGAVFFSTLNRNPKSFALAILSAEYLFGLLPRGTHSYERLIRPSELARAARHVGLEVGAVSGMRYNPITSRAGLAADTSVNYLVQFLKSV